MEGKGRIVACELNEERVKRLEHTIKLSGANSILVLLSLRSNGLAIVWYLNSKKQLIWINASRVKKVCLWLHFLTQSVDIEVYHGDFLGLNPDDPSFAKVSIT